MAKLNAQLHELLKSCSKDSESESRLKDFFEQVLEKSETVENHLSLLENAIKNDYDSILITELTLEKPGPRIVYVNDGFTKMTGYTREEVLGKTPRILQGEKTDQRVLDRLKKRLIEGQAFFGHTVNYRKDGSEFINQWDIHPLTSSDGEITHWVSYQRDITERHLLSKVLFDANIDFEKLEEESKRTFVDLDVQGNIISGNRLFRDAIGVDSDTLKEVKIWDLVSEDNRNEVESLFSDFDSSVVSDEKYLWEFTNSNGANLELEADIKWFVSNEETIIRIHFDNVTLRARVIDTLKKKTENLKSLLDAHEEFSLKFKKDTEGNIYCSYVSETFRDVTGKSEKDILDKGIQVALCENSLEVINEQLKKAFSGTLCSEKCEYVGKNDEVVTVIQSFKPVFNEDTNSVKAVKSVALLELDT